MSPFPHHHLPDTTWRRVAAVGWIFLVVFAGLFAYRSKSEVDEVGDRVTKIESPCQRYGAKSKICERAFEEAASSINHKVACFFQHQAGVHPPSCEGVHLRIDAPTSAKGGDASTPHTGSSQPEPSTGGSPGSHAPQNHPPQHVPDTPQGEAPQSPSGTAAPQAPSAPSSPPAQPSPPSSPPPPVSESANNGGLGEVVEGVGNTVDEVVCSVNALGIEVCH